MIDGGGIKGIFPASFLKTVEETLGVKVTEHFDLIVGTSTGGIIALGLGLGFSAKEILEFYETSGPVIFKGNGFIRFLRSMGFSKYSSEPLRDALLEKFGERILGESKNRLVIPSVNLETGEVHVYKTAHHERFQRDYKEKVVDIALATSAAPVYFPTYRSAMGAPLVDGGVWANNPTGFAVVEAIGVLNWPREEIKVLSIGCTAEALNIKKARFLPMGSVYWATKIVNLFMSTQSSSSMGVAELLIGKENIVRVNPCIANGKFGLDVIKEGGSLKGLGDTEARKALPDVKLFFQDKAEAFKSYY